MISRRHYKNPKTIKEALEELKKGAGTQFDHYIAKVLIEILGKEEMVNVQNWA